MSGKVRDFDSDWRVATLHEKVMENKHDDMDLWNFYNCTEKFCNV